MWGRQRTAEAWEQACMGMLATIRRYGVRDERVLLAMERVPRHRFIPDGCRAIRDAYGDHPVPIGHRQTVSQPFIVAYMTEKLRLKPGDKVLEIGVGSGYQQAVFAEMGVRCYGVERIPELAERAARTLEENGFPDVHIRVGDGYRGWPEEAPFDAILTTCAAPEVPPELVGQLSAGGGRMILPVGVGSQDLVVLEKQGNRITRQVDIAVRFVPMVKGAVKPHDE